MLNIKQRNFTAVVALLTLSFSAFANTGMDNQGYLNKEKPHNKSNLVELYKVKTYAIEHIRGIEAKLLTTDEDNQETLLVELAESLLYYNVRHNKGDAEKYNTSRGVNSLSGNGVNGNVSKNVNSKVTYSSPNIYRKALNAYKKASKLSLNKNRIKYTRKLSELAVKLKDKNELVETFDELLQHSRDETGTYLAHVDYADGLAKFKDNAADTQFLSAINMRTPVDGVEANFRYANYLLDNGKPREALNVLDKFTFEERRMYVHIVLLKQKTMHQLAMDTQEVDAEVQILRKKLSNNPFIGALPKFTGIINQLSKNILDIPTAHAFTFAHNNEGDDSRGLYANKWVTGNFMFSTSIVNAAEVIYNNARGEQQKGRIGIAWAIRNRATISMNGCGVYPGAEGHPEVNFCRANTPSGADPLYAEISKRYSCVIHGGTVTSGGQHTQMNDAHVDIVKLEESGIIWDILFVINGWVPETIGSNYFLTGLYPNNNLYTGNPNGAQEWRDYDYCAEDHSCKVNLGGINGSISNQGEGGYCEDNESFDKDIYFWGRSSNLLALDIVDE